jgi:hypothetical protein
VLDAGHKALAPPPSTCAHSVPVEFSMRICTSIAISRRVCDPNTTTTTLVRTRMRVFGASADAVTRPDASADSAGERMWMLRIRTHDGCTGTEPEPESRGNK